VLLTNTLVPTVLALLGPRINLGDCPLLQRVGWRIGPRLREGVAAMGALDVAHPWLALFVAGILCSLLAWQIRRLDTSVPRVIGFRQRRNRCVPPHPENMDREGVVESLRIIVELSTDSIAQTEREAECADRVTKRSRSDPRSGRVISITHCGEQPGLPSRDLSRETRRTFLSSDGKARC